MHRYFKLAYKIAKSYKSSKMHGAVIAKGSKIIGVGTNNMTKTHPKSKKLGNTIHAELSAIIDSDSSIYGATLYSARVLINGSLGLSKPCRHCKALIIEYGIKNIMYFDGYKIVQSKVSDL